MQFERWQGTEQLSGRTFSQREAKPRPWDPGMLGVCLQNNQKASMVEQDKGGLRLKSDEVIGKTSQT